MILKFIKWKPSWRISANLALFSCLLAALYFASCAYNKDRLGGVLYSDPEGYYLYLPAVFVYQGFEKVPIETKIQFFAYPGTKKIFTKYTYGVALMEAPFFLITHIYKLITDPPAADGCCEAYIKSVMFAACFYALAGITILFYTLKARFSAFTSLITAIIILSGTNLYFYTICAPGMSHVYSFFLVALFAWLTPTVLYSNNFKWWGIYGFVSGLIVLTRPTNCVLLLYPLLYGCYSWPSFKERIILFKNRLAFIALSVFVALGVFIPQFVYWKYLSGSFLMDSYSNESFQNWYTPKILKVLFDVQNGWLLYTPVMVLALCGLFIGIKKKMPESFPVVIMLIISTYVFGSWWCWWFGGAFGHRCYIEFYPLLAFGLAIVINSASRNKYLGAIITMLILACIYYNIRLTYLYVYPWERPSWTWERYWDVVKSIF